MCLSSAASKNYIRVSKSHLMQLELHLFYLSILHHAPQPSPPLLVSLYMSCSLRSVSCLLCLSSVSFRRLLCMLSDSRSIACPLCLCEPAVSAEITAARPVCVEQSLSSSRVLRKLDAKQSFTTTQLAESSEVVHEGG